MMFRVWSFLFKENDSTSIEEVVFWRYRDVRNTKTLRCVLENSDYILGLLKKKKSHDSSAVFYTHSAQDKNVLVH